MKPDISLIFPDSPFLEVSTMFPPLGIMYIASYLRHFGQEAQCLDLALGHDYRDAEADIIGISFTTPQRESAFELVRHFKREGKTVVAGGPHPTHMETECLEAGVDKVFKGYGEHELLEWMTNTKVAPLPIDDVPFPDRDALPISAYRQTIDGNPNSRRSTPIISVRGCPFKCSFCSQVDPKYIPQGTERTIQELYHLRDNYGYTAFTIYDDSFVCDKPRFNSLHARLKDEDFLLRCFSRTSGVDEETSEKLAEMGVIAVGLGVESGSDKILKLNMKRTSRRINTDAVKNLQKYGIEAKAFLIVGLPGETEETIKETLSWIEEARPDSIGASIFQPLPGSEIFNNPEKYKVNFEYNGQPLVYRGKRGEYVSNVEMIGLTPEEVVNYHKVVEDYHVQISRGKTRGHD